VLSSSRDGTRSAKTDGFASGEYNGSRRNVFGISASVLKCDLLRLPVFLQIQELFIS
jgi:hypothetical protein